MQNFIGAGSLGGETSSARLSAVAVAGNTLAHANELSSRVMGLADRLLGMRPPTPTDAASSQHPKSDGVLPTLEDAARETDDCIEHALIAINRIEAALP